METVGTHGNTADEFDLRQFEDDFAETTVEEMHFEEPPDGKYQVVVDRVEMARSKTSGQPMLKWRLKILGPHCAGRYLFRNNMIANPENLKWLKTDLATCGMDVNTLKLSDLPNRVGELLDIALEIKKQTKGDFANVYFSRRIQIDLPPGHASSRDGGSHSDDLIPF